MVRMSEEDGEEAATLVFSQARDVEGEHAKLYKKALDHLIAQRSTEYYLCPVCGHISEGKPPDTCPICGASSLEFERIP
jgi:rubrerythrin